MSESMSFTEKASEVFWEVGASTSKTLFYPIAMPVIGIISHQRIRRITGVFLLAALILTICAKYINTQSMHNFNNVISHAYKVSAMFLGNKTHAILVGCTGSLLYLLVGREWVNQENKENKYQEGYESGYENSSRIPPKIINDEFFFFIETESNKTKRYKLNVKSFKIEAQEDVGIEEGIPKPMTFREKASEVFWEVGKISAKTLIYPIVMPMVGIVKHQQKRRITAVFLLAIVILAICAKYANTQPMHNFNNNLSHVYKVIADFLGNKAHAILVGCAGSILYLLIGREWINQENREIKYKNGYQIGKADGKNAPRKTFEGECFFVINTDGKKTLVKFTIKPHKVMIVSEESGGRYVAV